MNHYLRAKNVALSTMSFICFNGTILPADEAIFTAQNRGFKYGDGVFETIKVYNGTMPWAAYHFERLAQSLLLLKMQLPPSVDLAILQAQILELCRINHCLSSARVRLAVYRQADENAAYVIEALMLDDTAHIWQEAGLTIDVFPDAQKPTDAYANLKTANYLPYVLADIYCKEKGLDECVVLNSFGHISDASKANVFAVKDGEIYTPALHQGCVNGVMRRYLLDKAKAYGYIVHQSTMEEDFLLEADEVFLTNAIRGMRWVKQLREKAYGFAIARQLYHQVLWPVYQ